MFSILLHTRKSFRNSSQSCCLLKTAPFSPTWSTSAHLNHFSDAAKNFGLTINLRKTEVLYHPHPLEVYSPLQISIDGTKLNKMEHFTYLGSLISNDVTVCKDLDKGLCKANSFLSETVKENMVESFAPSLHKDPGIYRAVIVPTVLHSADLCPLPEVGQAT